MPLMMSGIAANPNVMITSITNPDTTKLGGKGLLCGAAKHEKAHAAIAQLAIKA